MPLLHHYLLLHFWLFSVASQAPSRESQHVAHYPVGNWQVKKSYLPSASACSTSLTPHASSYWLKVGVSFFLKEWVRGGDFR